VPAILEAHHSVAVGSAPPRRCLRRATPQIAELSGLDALDGGRRKPGAGPRRALRRRARCEEQNCCNQENFMQRSMRAPRRRSVTPAGKRVNSCNSAGK